MTDQKYKLSDRLRPGVECAPWAIDEVRKMEATIAAAPEPVCRWTLHTNFPYDFWGSECGSELGHGFERIDDGPDDWNFCPHCGRKVEVVDDE